MNNQEPFELRQGEIDDLADLAEEKGIITRALMHVTVGNWANCIEGDRRIQTRRVRMTCPFCGKRMTRNTTDEGAACLNGNCPFRNNTRLYDRYHSILKSMDVTRTRAAELAVKELFDGKLSNMNEPHMRPNKPYGVSNKAFFLLPNDITNAATRHDADTLKHCPVCGQRLWYFMTTRGECAFCYNDNCRMVTDIDYRRELLGFIADSWECSIFDAVKHANKTMEARTRTGESRDSGNKTLTHERKEQ